MAHRPGSGVPHAIQLSNGNLLVEGKTWTGFANSEEQFADNFVGQRIQPFWIEDEAKKLPNTNFITGGMFKAFAVRDGRLITGQQQFSGGAAARLTPRWTVAFDLAWHRWSTFENPAAHIELGLDLKQFQDLVDIPPQEPLPLPHFHDIAIPRLGVEHTRGGARWRAGYAYEPSPAPAQRGATNFIDNDKHTLALGAGVDKAGLGGIVLKPISFDFALGITWLPERTHAKLIAADPVGVYRSAGVIVTGSVTSRWRF